MSPADLTNVLEIGPWDTIDGWRSRGYSPIEGARPQRFVHEAIVEVFHYSQVEPLKATPPVYHVSREIF